MRNQSLLLNNNNNNQLKVAFSSYCHHGLKSLNRDIRETSHTNLCITHANQWPTHPQLASELNRILSSSSLLNSICYSPFFIFVRTQSVSSLMMMMASFSFFNFSQFLSFFSWFVVIGFDLWSCKLIPEK